MAISWFIRLRLEDDRVIAPEEHQRRVVARTIIRIGKDYELLSFRCVAEHMHIEPRCDRADAGQFARRVEIALTKQLPHNVGFKPARFDPLKDQAHLLNAFGYTLGQDGHHDYRLDPYHDASALPELLCFRAGPTYLRSNVDKYLPEIRHRSLEVFLEPLTLEHPILSYAPLAAAGAAALALPDLSGNSRAAVLARAAAVRIGVQGLYRREVADLLGVDRRTVTNLLQETCTPPARVITAVELQLRLRQQTPRSRR